MVLAMPRLVLTVHVVEAALREAGDGRDRAGENAVNVALLWPRPGKAEALGTTGLVRLRDHAHRDEEPDRPAAFRAPVLKEVVAGEVALLVHVVDRDRRGGLQRFLRRLAGSVVGEAGGLMAAGSGGLLRVAFTEAAERGSVLVADRDGDGERLEVVAVSRQPVVVAPQELDHLADAGRPRDVRVALAAPQDLERRREKGRLAPGRPNGHLVLRLTVTRA